MSGKKSPVNSGPTAFTSPEPIPVKKEDPLPVRDVLADIAPATPQYNQTASPLESNTIAPIPAPEGTIPDWLKESTSLSAPEISTTPEYAPTPTEVVNLPDSTEALAPTPLFDETIPSEIPAPAAVVEAPSADLPDWLKGADVQTEPVVSTPEETVDESVSMTSNATIPSPDVPASDNSLSDLPAWMQSMDKASLEQEVTDEINTPVHQDTSSYEDIPDWLKSTPKTPEVSGNA